MAIYHLRVKVISRALGRDARPGGATRRSIVAAAAYRSGDRLYDETQGKFFQFDKPELVHAEIMAPEGAPAWVYDREALWNRVELSEYNKDGSMRADAQLARELEVSLPRELSPEQHIALTRGFIQKYLVADGMVADFAIHVPIASDGGEHPHAHILCTKRRLDPARPFGFAKTKEREWDEFEAIKQPWNAARKRYNNVTDPAHPAPPDVAAAAKAELEHWEAQRRINQWRSAWAEAANGALAEAGSAARIDHRTLEKQGLARLAEIALGWARHIPMRLEQGYDFLRERLTHWIAIREDNTVRTELGQIRARDPARWTQRMMDVSDIYEEAAGRFRRSPPPIPEYPIREVNHDR